MTVIHHSATGAYDVIIVGGGPAGSTAAALLARSGQRVLVLEREAFPRYHIGESLITGMMSIIEELGLTERLEAMGFPRKYGISLVWGDEPRLWDVTFAEAGSYEYSYHVDRARFDALLLERARELGAEVIEEATVDDVITDGERVVGVRYRQGGSGGRRVEATATMTIDASGQSRVLSRRTTTVHRHPDLCNVATWSYFSPFTPLPDHQANNILVESTDGGWFWGIPVSDSTMSVGYVTSVEAAHASPGTPAERFSEAMAGSQIVKDRVSADDRAGEFRTTRDWSYTAEQFYGRGWLAIGDAATFVDPLFSSGVWLGMSGGWLAARALQRLFEDRSSEERVMAEFERVYRQLASDILGYVRFFYDPSRKREDYFERASAAVEAVSGQSRVGFVALISGISALPYLGGELSTASAP